MGEPRCLGSEHKVQGSSQRGPKGHSNIAGPASEEPVGEMSVKHVTLEDWRLLQEQARPKPQFSLRKVHGALPANAVVSHQSKYQTGTTHSRPTQPLAWDFLSQGAQNMGPVPGPRVGGRRRARGLWLCPSEPSSRLEAGACRHAHTGDGSRTSQCLCVRVGGGWDTGYVIFAKVGIYEPMYLRSTIE